MTAHTTFAPSSLAVRSTGNKHRRSLIIVSALVLAPILFLAVYGANYYTLSQTDRPHSPKHHLLQPGGTIGVNMGVLGVLMLCAIFVYPLRKRWAWLQRQGNSRHWLDYHVILGIAAPVFIAFHSAFKFRGVAGIAFWVMVGVAISGLVGRYLYSLIPRHVASAEASLRELHELLWSQTIVPRAALRPLLRLPRPDQAARRSTVLALGHIVTADVARPFRIAGLRMRGASADQIIACCAGLRPTDNVAFEWVLALACQQQALAHRILFLSQIKSVFQWWHVIHRPFSYAFAVLALFHICVAMLMGFI
jgi:hypothetical protein